MRTLLKSQKGSSWREFKSSLDKLRGMVPQIETKTKQSQLSFSHSLDVFNRRISGKAKSGMSRQATTKKEKFPWGTNYIPCTPLVVIS